MTLNQEIALSYMLMTGRTFYVQFPKKVRRMKHRFVYNY